MNETLKVIITKYALTSGVFKAQGTTHADFPGMFEQINPTGFPRSIHYHGRDWHATKTEAKEDVLKRSENLRKSLMNRLAKLDKKTTAAIQEIELMDL